MWIISVAPEDILHREINSVAENVSALFGVGCVAKLMPDMNTGIIKTKNNAGKIDNGRSCLRASQNWSPSMIGLYFDLKHTLRASFITMATIAKDDTKRMIIAGPYQRENFSMVARSLVSFSAK